MNLKQIMKMSPKNEMGNGQWAMYSVSCCWWTTFAEDLGEKPPVRYEPETQCIVPNPGGPGLPCCPHCGSLLMQAKLKKFVKAAKRVPGVMAFMEYRHS